jgi:ribosomal-protein-alanine N-acetyltransferase
MLPSGYVLRTCGFRDLDQVSKVETASFPDSPYSTLDFVSCLLMARDGFVVACKDGPVVGYVIAMRRGQEGSIQSIAVLPEFRGKGIGEALMRSAISHLAGRFKQAYLLVDVNNERAIRLYRKLSFSDTGKVIRGYYRNGDDAIEMVRELA